MEQTFPRKMSWRLVNQSSWSLTINVPYVLSDQITVPLLLQTSDPWRSDIYAYNTSPVDNIERWGCLMTSGAMIVNYLSQAQENPFRTNPRILNNWLKDNSGYTENNGVKHAWVGKYGRTSPQNIAIYWNRSIQYNTTVVDYYLRSGYPVVLGVKPTVVDGKTIPGHYVVATGRATENGVQTYRINDPYYGSTTLKSKWSNVALTMILYSASEANQQLLNFVAQSPIEFVVVDPIGRKSGFDPTTNTTWTQIPDAYYMYDGLGTVSGDGDPILMKTMNVPDPLDGEYTVIVYGTGSGSYTMEVSSMDWQGISGHQKFIGTTNPGQTHIYTVSYTQVVKQVFLPLVTR